MTSDKTQNEPKKDDEKTPFRQREMTKRIMAIVDEYDEFAFDLLPRNFCTIYDLPEFVSTVFCMTKCFYPCARMQKFQFITDKCPDIFCDEDHPCSDCLEKIEAFKEMMPRIRGVFDQRSKQRVAEWRAMQWVRLQNKKAQDVQRMDDDEIASRQETIDERSETWRYNRYESTPDGEEGNFRND